MNIKKLAVVFLLSIFLFVGCATTEGLYGLNPTGSNVVFVLDVSSSMEGEQEEVLWKRETKGVVDDVVRAGASEVDKKNPDIGLGAKIYQFFNNEVRQRLTLLAGAKRELHATIRDFPPNTRFTILVFSKDVTYWKTDLAPATEENKALAFVFLDELGVSSYTSIGKALKAGLAVKNVDEIFLITDGDPTDGSPSAILKDIHKLNAKRNVRINAIGLGEGQNVEFLTLLAYENSGIFVQKMN